MNILQKILNSGQKIIIDGGTGTELAKLGADTSDSGNWVSLSHMTNPELITKIHQNFVHSGADVIIANTYATNKLTFRADLPKVNEILENHLNITNQDDIITEGVKIAKNAVKNMISKKGNKVLVAASISAHSPGCHRDKITGKWVGDWPEDLDEFLRLYTETVEALLKGEPDLLFIEMSRGVNPACDLISRAIGQVYERKQKEMMNTEQNLPPVFIGFSTRLTYKTLSVLNNKNEKILTQQECESLSSLPMRYIEQTKNLTNENLCYFGDMGDSGEHFKSFTAEEIKRHFDLLGFIPAGINIMHTKPEAIFESLKVVDEVRKSLEKNGKSNLMVGIYQDNQEFVNPRSIFYQVDKAVLKKYIDDWAEFGFDLIGGCCGTDCEFLEILQKILESSSVLH